MMKRPNNPLKNTVIAIIRSNLNIASKHLPDNLKAYKELETLRTNKALSILLALISLSNGNSFNLIRM